MHFDAAYYRAKAAKSRKLAESIGEADVKAHLLDVARQYDKLAKDADVKR
jgi:hypothetical protein